MDQTLPVLIRALLQAQRYPDGVQRVELVQTHISWVLLAGDVAYKIKKPLKLPFLDFSTLAHRRACCLDELRLNRRYAPDIYLDVVGIFNTPQEPTFSELGQPIEYAVKMRRFDEAGRLDRVCARGALQPAHVTDLADSLVTFHQAASIAPADSRFGSPEQVMAPARDNFHDLLRLLPDVALRARLLALQAWTEAQFQQLAPVMEARKQSGWVRECHGDLHLANLVLIDGRVRMFDCIEFSEDLRWVDAASDIAFTYVDLLAHGRPGLADWFIDGVLSRSGDYDAARMLRFYAVYRAMVRAKVEAIRMSQTQGNNLEVRAHIALAEGVMAPPPARLLITHGLSGCGKTHVTSLLLQSEPHASTLRLRADVERKRLFGLAVGADSGSATNAGIYTRDAHRRTYDHLRQLAGRLLCAGWSIMVDATFLKRADRDRFRSLASETGATFGILAPRATPTQLRARILSRGDAGRDASEATLDVLEQQMREIEPLGPDEQALVLRP